MGGGAPPPPDMGSSVAVIVLFSRCFGGGRWQFGFANAEFQEIDHAGGGGGGFSVILRDDVVKLCAQGCG